MSLPLLTWVENDTPQQAHWRSENGAAPPRRVQVADDAITADMAYQLACEGTAILWRGDFFNARQLLLAMGRRMDRKKRKIAATPTDAFHQHRMAAGQRARAMGMLLIPFQADHSIPLRRAPDVRQACMEAYGTAEWPYVASLRELNGLIGAHEWRKKGVHVPALNAQIHPHYAVFAPIRGEYVELVAKAPLPSGTKVAFDIGTGTGVLAAVLARRGITKIVATDQSPRALACARENLERLGLSERVELLERHLFPPGRAPLIVCNPPWLPAKANSALEQAVYDPESQMLRGFLSGLREHLEPGGEGWLILSDLAEHLGLRSAAELSAWIAAAGLKVRDRLDIRPSHPKAGDPDDPLHAARAAEITSLWRLIAA
jgi:methylase of polypeptide subunit release factors